MKKGLFVALETLKSIPAALIFATSWHLSSLERIEQMPSFWNADKLVHTICFAGLAFWVSFGISAQSKKDVALSSLIVSVYGVIDEIHQSFVPTRSASAGDWIFDTIGAIFGAIAFVFFSKKIAQTLRRLSKRCGG